MRRQPSTHFFDTKAAAETYARKLNPSATITVVEEEPAELLLDKEANVISLSGKVAKRALSPEQKKRSDALYGQAKLLGQTLQIFGQDKLRLASQRNAGPRFQFENYPKNWIPPHASISYPTGDHVKIQIPARFSVSVKCMEAMAIPHVDQYQYLVAQGTSGINHGLSGADIVNRLRQWDKRYGLTVLKANWNSVFCRLDKQPTDGGTLDREIKEFCPEMEESQEESQPKGPRNLCLWWD